MAGGAHVGHVCELDEPGHYRGTVAEKRRRFHSSNESTIQGDYHLPFGKIEARTEALRWIWHA